MLFTNYNLVLQAGFEPAKHYMMPYQDIPFDRSGTVAKFGMGVSLHYKCSLTTLACLI